MGLGLWGMNLTLGWVLPPIFVENHTELVYRWGKSNRGEHPHPVLFLSPPVAAQGGILEIL